MRCPHWYDYVTENLNTNKIKNHNRVHRLHYASKHVKIFIQEEQSMQKSLWTMDFYLLKFGRVGIYFPWILERPVIPYKNNDNQISPCSFLVSIGIFPPHFFPYNTVKNCI